MNKIRIKTEIETIKNQIVTKDLSKETQDNLEKRIELLKLKLSKRGRK